VIDLAIMQKMRTVQSLIAAGKMEEALAAIDELSAWYRQHSGVMNAAEKLQFIGGLADFYSQVDEPAKGIPYWEELCELADSDLAQLGIMATDEEVIRTGFDFLRLGRAYRKHWRTANARKKFERGAEILGELGMNVDVETLINSDEKVLVGEYKGQHIYVR
jgi:hypothetical protein